MSEKTVSSAKIRDLQPKLIVQNFLHLASSEVITYFKENKPDFENFKNLIQKVVVIPIDEFKPKWSVDEWNKNFRYINSNGKEDSLFLKPLLPESISFLLQSTKRKGLVVSVDETVVALAVRDRFWVPSAPKGDLQIQIFDNLQTLSEQYPQTHVVFSYAPQHESPT